MAKSKKSPTPSGTSISRSVTTLTCSWKGSYDKAVQFKQKINGAKFPATATKLAKKATSKKISYTIDNYFPFKQSTNPNKNLLTSVGFTVRGQKEKTKKVTYKMSSWTKTTTLTFVKPRPPVVSYERKQAYVTDFKMDLPEHVNTGKYWGTHIQYRTCLRIDTEDTSADSIPESAWTNYTSKAIRNTITGQDTTSFTYTVNDEPNSTKIINSKSAVRWFQARSAGPPGTNGWVTSRVAYSEPYAAVINKATVKPNDRHGLDCVVNWSYTYSVSFPIDEMKIQYSFCSPGGVYINYLLTGDLEPKEGKKYYTVIGSLVSNPKIDDIASYYDKIESEYDQTNDEEVDEDKTYYTPTLVASPIVAEIDDYYNDMDGVYKKTTDIEIDSSKSYYTFSIVQNPDDSQIGMYYERTIEYYVKSSDTYLVKNKKYYTLEGTEVITPIEDNINEYYERLEVNYIEPINPSWQDATIGGDNSIIPGNAPASLTTREATVGFSIDQTMPDEQLLYIRVNTVHNNKTTNSKYYLCTDEEGNVSDKETVLTAPSEPVVEPPEGNLIHIETSSNSEAVGVHIAIVFIPNNNNEDSEVIAVVEPDPSGAVSTTIEIPPSKSTTSFGIGVYSFIGQYSLSSRIEEDNLGYNLYMVNPILRSKLVTFGGDIPLPPTNVTANHIGNGNVIVTWDWNWKEATAAEVAWSDFSDALDSNSQPSTYEVPNSKSNRLIVRSLELGKTWYFWVRLKHNDNSSIWSTVVFENLSSSPSIPSLSLSKRYINADEKFTASWTYVSADGTTQQAARICECIVDGNNIIHGNPIVEIPNDDIKDPEVQYVTLDPTSEKLNWSEGEDHYLAVQVISSSGMISEDWSEPVQISTIPPINSKLGATSLYPEATEYDENTSYSVGDYAIKRIVDPDDNSKELGILYRCITAVSSEEWDEEKWIADEEQPIQELRELPLTVEIIPSDENLDTMVILERSKDYFIDRPDGGEYGGHEGEIVIQTYDDEDGEFTILQEDLTNYLDDGAYYYLTTRITDTFGQIHENRYEFMVHWDHQALTPEADIELDKENDVIKITIKQPEIEVGDDITDDVCDIYRRSSEGFELLYSNAEFNNTYVDPYPTIGEHGGYRIVYRTRNGDYITSDNDFAWVTLDDEENIFHSPSHIIDFGEDTINLMYNVDIDNNWRKDFQETHYLGGSIQGDWNSGVSKTVTVSVNVPTIEWDTIADLRTLALFNGECHVRTRDGSNFLANIDVSEKLPYNVYTDPTGNITQLCTYSLSITRLDPIEPDGIILEDWLETLPTDEEETP